MWLLTIAAICSGLFAGAAIYVNAVEHPARRACGTETAIREFGPSYHRAAIMQALLAIGACAAGFGAAWLVNDAWIALGAVLVGIVVPFTLIVIRPINQRLLDPDLDPHDAKAGDLLTRWGRLHAVRSVASAAAFVLFLVRLGL